MSGTGLENPFAPGEVVQLRSGGPFMTVIRRDEDDGTFLCSWFWSGRYQTGWFHPFLLGRPSEETVETAASLRTKNAEADRVKGEGASENSLTGQENS